MSSSTRRTVVVTAVLTLIAGCKADKASGAGSVATSQAANAASPAAAADDMGAGGGERVRADVGPDDQGRPPENPERPQPTPEQMAAALDGLKGADGWITILDVHWLREGRQIEEVVAHDAFAELVRVGFTSVSQAG